MARVMAYRVPVSLPAGNGRRRKALTPPGAVRCCGSGYRTLAQPPAQDAVPRPIAATRAILTGSGAPDPSWVRRLPCSWLLSGTVNYNRPELGNRPARDSTVGDARAGLLRRSRRVAAHGLAPVPASPPTAHWLVISSRMSGCRCWVLAGVLLGVRAVARAHPANPVPRWRAWSWYAGLSPDLLASGVAHRALRHDPLLRSTWSSTCC